MEEKGITLPKQSRGAICNFSPFGLHVISISSNSVSDCSVSHWNTSFFKALKGLFIKAMSYCERIYNRK